MTTPDLTPDVALSFEELVARGAELALSDERLMYGLVQARKAAGLTQRDVAELLGIRQPSVAGFEAHDSDPKLSTIRRYALAVGAHIDHVVTTRKPVIDPVREWNRTSVAQVSVDAPFSVHAADRGVAPENAPSTVYAKSHMLAA